MTCSLEVSYPSAISQSSCWQLDHRLGGDGGWSCPMRPAPGSRHIARRSWPQTADALRYRPPSGAAARRTRARRVPGNESGREFVDDGGDRGIEVGDLVVPV